MRIQDVGVLIIDDVNAVRAQVKELLRSVGFEKISVAANGLEATHFLENTSIQVVLSDMHMTPMDGMSLLHFVRSHPKYNKIVFIMVSADGTRERVIETIQSGVDDYLLKPLTIDQVQKKLFAQLAKRKVLV